jgi:hypothetical protein
MVSKPPAIKKWSGQGKIPWGHSRGRILGKPSLHKKILTTGPSWPLLPLALAVVAAPWPSKVARAWMALLRSFSLGGEVVPVGHMGFGAPSDLAGRHHAMEERQIRVLEGWVAAQRKHGGAGGRWRSGPNLGRDCYVLLRPWPFIDWTAYHGWRVLRGCCTDLRLADVAARVVLDLPEFSVGLGDRSWPVAWGLDLNNGSGPRVPLAPRR